MKAYNIGVGIVALLLFIQLTVAAKVTGVAAGFYTGSLGAFFATTAISVGLGGWVLYNGYCHITSRQ